MNGPLNGLVGQLGGMLRNFDDLEGRALRLQLLDCLQSLITSTFKLDPR